MIWRFYLLLRRIGRWVVTDIEAVCLPLAGEDEADALSRRAW